MTHDSSVTAPPKAFGINEHRILWTDEFRLPRVKLSVQRETQRCDVHRASRPEGRKHRRALEPSARRSSPTRVTGAAAPVGSLEAAEGFKKGGGGWCDLGAERRIHKWSPTAPLDSSIFCSPPDRLFACRWRMTHDAAL